MALSSLFLNSSLMDNSLAINHFGLLYCITQLLVAPAISVTFPKVPQFAPKFAIKA